MKVIVVIVIVIKCREITQMRSSQKRETEARDRSMSIHLCSFGLRWGEISVGKYELKHKLGS